MLENESIEAVRGELVAAGYPLVQKEVKLEGGKRRIDLLAWATDPSGALRPMLAVEVKADAHPRSVQVALMSLAAAVSKLDVPQTAIWADGQWMVPDGGFVEVGLRAGPPPAPSHHNGSIRDVDFAQQLVQESAEAVLMADPRVGSMAAALEVVLSSCVASDFGVSLPLVGPEIDVDSDVFTKAWLEEMRQVRGGPDFTDPVQLLDAMAGLLLDGHHGDSVVDPFAGLGGGIFAAHRASRGRSVRLLGTEINSNLANDATRLLRLSGIDTEIRNADSFTAEVQTADLVLSNPPFGSRLSRPYVAPFGQTKDGDLAVLDVVARSLNKGGRAVIVTPKSWAIRRSAEPMRKWLAENFWIKALVSLPPLLQGSASFSPLLVVVENRPPSQTLVAALERDWETQLGASGEFRQAYRDHQWR